jgi:hypothetical protein
MSLLNFSGGISALIPSKDSGIIILLLFANSVIILRIFSKYD